MATTKLKAKDPASDIYNVTDVNIRYIKQRKTWKHIKIKEICHEQHK